MRSVCARIYSKLPTWHACGVTGAVQHHCDIQTHSISSLLDTITHLTPGTQPRQEPRQPDPATYRQPGNPATRQHPAAPGSTWKCPHIVSAWQHPAAPGSTRQQTRHAADPANPAPDSTRQPGKHPATPRQPGNPTRQHPATRQPGLKGRGALATPGPSRGRGGHYN